MQIIQALPSLSYGDAIGNDVVALDKALKEMGYKTHIYAEHIAERVKKGIASDVKKMPPLSAEDVIIYHLSTGTEMNYKIAEYTAKKIVIYHNVTPPYFFRGYNLQVVRRVTDGLNGVRFLADKVDYCLADSEFNKQDLIKMGYNMPIDVLPILIPFDDYKKSPSQSIIKNYRDGKHNIIFTGRIAPNKCHQDIIAAFACYKKYYDPEARLFLVGYYEDNDIYCNMLKRYVQRLRLRDVVFTGHIKFEDILAFYQIADLFLCMSEHEGFCVPLVESMFFEVPIIAYNSTAIPETLGNAGIMIDKKDPIETAALMNRVINDKNLQEAVKENQRARLKEFQYEKIVKKFEVYLQNELKKKK